MTLAAGKPAGDPSVKTRSSTARIASRLLLSLLTLAGLPAAASAQEVFGQQGVPAAALPEVVFEPLSKALGVGVPGVPLLALDPIDHDALRREDALAPSKGKPMRVALGRPVSVSAAQGVWVATPDGGSLWTIDLRATGANALRVGFMQMNLPEGALLSVFNPLMPIEGTGPYAGTGDAKIGEQYSGTIWADTVRVELYLPAGAPRALPMRIDNLQHFYRDLQAPAAPAPANGEPLGIVGACHTDVTCQPTWANPARAVAIYFTTSASGTGQCTGQLVANNSNDLTPYFLTASHCGSSAAEVATYECFWLYQTSVCNGAAPTLASRAVTRGAELIGTRGQADGTLARLTGILPGGLFYQGWSATAINTAANQAVAGIHHPDGSFKRISFGNINNQAIYCAAGVGQAAGESYRVQWSSGVTESGSSGSGILRTDNQLLVGTLSCGSSVCGAGSASLNDIYGRFASFYSNVPAVSTALTAGYPDDTLEPNDSCAAPRDLSLASAFSQSNLVVKLVDEDWYRFSVGAGQTLTVTLAFAATQGNIDSQLFGTCGGTQLAAGIGTGTGETLTWTNIGASAATVTARVYINGTTPINTYSLSATSGVVIVPIIAQDACANAQNVSAGQTYTGTTAGATIDGAASCITTQRADVWYGFIAPGSGTVRIDTCTSAIDTVLSLHTACGQAAAVCNDDAVAGVGPCGSSNNLSSFVTRAMSSGERVLIRIASFSSTPGAFTMRVAFDQTPPPANDLCVNAQTVSTGSFPFNNTNALTDGPAEAGCALSFTHNGIDKDLWFAFIAPGRGTLTLDTCGAMWDTKLGVYAGECPIGPDTITACNDDASPACTTGTLASRVSVTTTNGGRYTIRVGGYRNTSGTVASGAGTLTVGFVVLPCGASDIAGPGPSIGADGELTADDVIQFISWFTSGDARADVAGPGPSVGGDGEFTADDVILFINRFTAGC